MKVAVVGLGSWGTAIARHLALLGHEVLAWSHGQEVRDGINEGHRNPRYLADVELPHNLVATSDLEESVREAQALVLVTPSTHLRGVCSQLSQALPADTPAIVLTKGVEQDSCKLMIEVAADELGNPNRLACLSGPNLAAEIAHDKPAAAVIAAYESELAAFFQKLFHAPLFRTYTSDDVIGVETCGAAKNIVAIACGISHGMLASDNTAAMLMTRGLTEISRLVAATGGHPLTCMGLAGMGDLVATCTSPKSRNFSFGVSFSQGETLAQYTERTHMVVEGYYACSSIRTLARKHAVEAPLTESVYQLLHGNLSLDEVAHDLMAREPRVEFYGIGRDEEE